MAPTPHRIAQTSTELKKLAKKNGPRLNERQQKQLERDAELEQRAARARKAEESRKAAKKKREEREAKDAKARRQIGVGLATQLVGYSHTQAQLKSGMEAFLGLSKKKDEEKRKKDLELTKKLEEIAEEMEKEPWDDDDDDEAGVGVDLPKINVSFGEQWADDDLDDDTLLEAHDLLVSDPPEEAPALVTSTKLPPSAPVSSVPPALLAAPIPPSKPIPLQDDREFIRTDGSINKAIEAVLDKLPEPLIELLSQDVSLKTPDWDPSLGLLHKLNPVGLPPHRLRIKVGCTVTVLRDLHTSSQLSKSQHLRVLRCERDRLECLVLDGQLQGTKTFLTRVSFIAKYKNLDQHPFQRTQFPIRVAIDVASSSVSQDTSQSGFKLPSIPGRLPPANFPRKPTPPAAKPKPPTNLNPDFKLPGVPASKSSSFTAMEHASFNKKAPSVSSLPTDCWDDFFESSTQVSRELASEATPMAKEPVKTSIAILPPVVDDIPPISTQDFDFSLDDLDEEPRKEEIRKAAPVTHAAPCKVSTSLRAKLTNPRPAQKPTSLLHPPGSAKPLVNTISEPTKPVMTAAKIAENATQKIPPARVSANSSRPLITTSRPTKTAGKCLNPGPFAYGILQQELAKLRASQLPKSMTGPFAKRRATTTPSRDSAPPAKKQYVPTPTPPSKPSAAAPIMSQCFENFAMSTQEVASFFDDDDDDNNMSFGSPPIANLDEIWDFNPNLNRDLITFFMGLLDDSMGGNGASSIVEWDLKDPLTALDRPFNFGYADLAELDIKLLE
ncbi:hypothetical protein G6011_04388 [Alternaria panax]|uniref:ATP-dependent DNA helicase n=1 Tax=Alternaria panax TaxID=48097 RepID=A0AAD4IH51_9PLEO|nr:hypothetical protein G6011_04388 [Alternaria panax]